VGYRKEYKVCTSSLACYCASSICQDAIDCEKRSTVKKSRNHSFYYNHSTVYHKLLVDLASYCHGEV
jgi:hypothetical protein